MSLDAGTRLGPYEIGSPVGKGGMGEVYRARDTKLDREVAIKVLPEEFAADEERLARFEREAKLLASLNHPNIASIHGFEESDGVKALVLELVEGPTLAERIEEGQIPVDEAIAIAKQIAEALEAGHEAGVIHRDLKPANIKLKDDGTVKVLDYGLAKALEGDSSNGADSELSQSPTLTRQGTQVGVILGTAAYMSPEQAKGKRVDKRTDVWAFGAVLYEMLCGRRAFEAEDISETLAFVLTKEPEWEGLPQAVAPNVRTVLRRCLAKEKKQRIRDIGDVQLALEGAFESAGSAEPEDAAPKTQLAPWQRPVPASIAAVLLIAGGGLAVWTGTRPEPGTLKRTSIVLPQAQQRTSLARRAVAISPSGTHVAYVANNQLYLRALDQLEARPLTTADSDASSPFFSPDGQWIGFFSPGALKKVALTGGAAVTLAEVPGTPYGASWGAEDTIVFSSNPGGIRKVAGTGGTPELLASFDDGSIGRQPQILPGREAVLYTSNTYRFGPDSWETAQVVVERMSTGERTVVVEPGSDARYVPTGHLVYGQGGTVLAVPFDVDSLEVTGGSVPLVEGVSRAVNEGPGSGGGAANFDIARTGALVYLPSRDGAGPASRRLVWVGRDGREDVVPAPPRTYRSPRLSPDGMRLVVGAQEDDVDLWVWDFSRETLTRLTFSKEGESTGIWTPDGERVIFSSGALDGMDLLWRDADGTGAIENLTDDRTAARFPQTLTPDGRLVYQQGLTLTGEADLHLLSLDGEPPSTGTTARPKRTEPLLVTEFVERNAAISPNGRWLAYASDEAGQFEIYVRPFPAVDDGKWQVSTAGGLQPLWGPDGRELFFRSEGGVMATNVDTARGFVSDTPVRVIEGRYYVDVHRSYDIAPDGKRFLMIKQADASVKKADDPFAGLTRIIVVQNWLEELKRLVPTDN